MFRLCVFCSVGPVRELGKALALVIRQRKCGPAGRAQFTCKISIPMPGAAQNRCRRFYFPPGAAQATKVSTANLEIAPPSGDKQITQQATGLLFIQYVHVSAYASTHPPIGRLCGAKLLAYTSRTDCTPTKLYSQPSALLNLYLHRFVYLCISSHSRPSVGCVRPLS